VRDCSRRVEQCGSFSSLVSQRPSRHSRFVCRLTLISSLASSRTATGVGLWGRRLCFATSSDPHRLLVASPSSRAGSTSFSHRPSRYSRRAVGCSVDSTATPPSSRCRALARRHVRWSCCSCCAHPRLSLLSVFCAAYGYAVVVSAHKADGARPRQKTQHRMRSDTKEKEHKRLDHRARSAPERRN